MLVPCNTSNAGVDGRPEWIARPGFGWATQVATVNMGMMLALMMLPDAYYPDT